MDTAANPSRSIAVAQGPVPAWPSTYQQVTMRCTQSITPEFGAVFAFDAPDGTPLRYRLSLADARWLRDWLNEATHL